MRGFAAGLRVGPKLFPIRKGSLASSTFFFAFCRFMAIVSYETIGSLHPESEKEASCATAGGWKMFSRSRRPAHKYYPLWHANALNVLAQIERNRGDSNAAIDAATKACVLAWCDGISADGKRRYAYQGALVDACKYHDESGAPVSDLPPFDESEFEPLPSIGLDPKDEFWFNQAVSNL